MEIYLLRHAHRNGNLKTLRDFFNEPLNEEGIRKAIKSASFLSKYEYFLFSSSMVKRCVQTRDLIAKSLINLGKKPENMFFAEFSNPSIFMSMREKVLSQTNERLKSQDNYSDYSEKMIHWFLGRFKDLINPHDMVNRDISAINVLINISKELNSILNIDFSKNGTIVIITHDFIISAFHFHMSSSLVPVYKPDYLSGLKTDEHLEVWERFSLL